MSQEEPTSEEEILRLNGILNVKYADSISERNPEEQFSKLEIAIACYERAHQIRTDQSDRSALFMIAVIYYDMAFRYNNENNAEGSSSSIANCLEKCMLIFDDDATDIIYKGQAKLLAAKAYRFIGKYDDAKRLLRDAKEIIKPENEQYIHVLRLEDELKDVS